MEFKRMIMNHHMFNNNTLNIFTDGSIRKIYHPDGTEETIGCAGGYACTGSRAVNMVDKSCTVIRAATNNITELLAVYEGLHIAQQYRNQFKKINIISDSKITVMGLREWIFNWIVPDVDRLISSTGMEPKNADLIMSIIYYILDNDLSVTFYHVNGHKDLFNEKDLNKAYKTFVNSNHIQSSVDINLIKNLCRGNEIVDSFTGVVIEEKMVDIGASYSKICYVPTNQNPDNIPDDWSLPEPIPTPLIKFIYKPFDANKYKKLINEI